MVVLGCCLVIGGLVYFAETEPLFKIESVEFTAPDLVAGLIVVVAVFWGLWNGFQFPPKIIVIPFACFFVATALSVLAADEKLRPAAALIQMVEFGSFAWGISLLTSHRRVLRVVHFILGIFVLETVIAAWQFAAGSDLDPNNPLRVYPHGTFSSQMKYGEFCAVSAAVAYALSISTPKKSARLVYVVTMLVLLFGAVIAHERAPWIAFLASGIITTFLSSRGKKRRILMMRFAAGILCVVLAVVSIPSLRESLISRIAEAQSQDVGTNTLLSRLMVWGLAWQFFQSHPVLGIGPKNFTLFSPQFLDLEETGWIEGADAHNIWLQTLAEGGVIGFITYLPLCFGILALAYSRLRDSQWADVRPFLLAYLAYHCFMMILSNAYFVKAEGHMHYLMIGLMLGVIRGKIGLGDKIDGTAGSLVSC
jgi:O-antigen ligase